MAGNIYVATKLTVTLMYWGICVPDLMQIG